MHHGEGGVEPKNSFRAGVAFISVLPAGLRADVGLLLHCGTGTYSYTYSPSELPVILEELKKSLLPGGFSKNRRLIGQKPTEAPSSSALGAATRFL